MIAQGSVEQVTAEPASRLGPFLDGREGFVVCASRRTQPTGSNTARSGS